jgi:hypothetical protein
MRILEKILFIMCSCLLACRSAYANSISTYQVNFNTSSLVGNTAGPFYIGLELVDGSGVGDGNNTVTLSGFNFSDGSALGGPVVFGGATGSLETGVSITDNSFVDIFSEQFAPGLTLSFTLTLTNNDDPGGIPDGLTLFLVDSSGVPLPTLAPSGDYFLTSALGSGGPVFNAYGSDSTRAPTGGSPVSIPVPTIAEVTSVPEPPSLYLIGSGALSLAALKKMCSGKLKSHRTPV